MHPQDLLAALAAAAGTGLFAFLALKTRNRLLTTILLTAMVPPMAWAIPPGRGVLIFIPLFMLLLYFAISRSRRHRKKEQLRRDLPTMLDSLVLGVEAGRALMPVLLESSEVLGGRSPLTAEISRLRHNVELGTSHPEALDLMRERLGLPTADAALGAISQALSLGTPIGRTVKEQSGRIRENLILEGERFANTLSIRLLIPLLLFIFPASFLVILSPVIVSLLERQPW